MSPLFYILDAKLLTFSFFITKIITSVRLYVKFPRNGSPWQGCKKKQKRPQTYTKRLSGALFVFLKLSLLKGLKNDSILEIEFARVDIIEKTVMHGNSGVCRNLICKVCRILCVHVVTHTVDG